MVGMRERAAKIDAVLDIRSSAGAGTDVRLRLPAARAYPRRRPLLMRWLGRWR
jgi:nitrate/nitrite-specific signal transduction histidine kinase